MRQFIGTPTAALTYAMTDTATDADGDTDTFSFTIIVRVDNSVGGPLGVCREGLLVRSRQSCTYSGTTDEFRVDAQWRAQFMFFTSGNRINRVGTTINGRHYYFVVSHRGSGVRRIDRVGEQRASARTGLTTCISRSETERPRLHRQHMVV